LIGCTPVISNEQNEENNIPFENSTFSPVVTTEVIRMTPPPTRTNQVDTPSPTEEPLPCSSPSPNDSHVQIGYRNIYPGQTTAETLEDLFGSPIRVINYDPGKQEWLYEYELEEGIGTFPIRVEDGVVVSISLQEKIPLGTILEQYGCPDVVFAVDMSEHNSGQYSGTSLIYLELGVMFIVEQFPLQIFDVESSRTHYFKPGSLDDFLLYHPSFQYENVAKQIYFGDALK
jgi:hypothetical protein